MDGSDETEKTLKRSVNKRIKEEEQQDDEIKDGEDENEKTPALKKVKHEEKATDQVVLANDSGESFLELGSNKRVTIRSWKGMTLVDFREFYEKGGKMFPGKKGISLKAEDQYLALKNLLVEGSVDAAIEKVTNFGVKEISYDLSSDIKKLSVRCYRGNCYVNIREYYFNKSTSEMAPGAKGIALNEDQYSALKSFVLDDVIDIELKRMTKEDPDTIVKKENSGNRERIMEKPTLQKNESGETFFTLSKFKRLTMRSWKGRFLYDIREFYENATSGKMMPGKKGISLNVEQFNVMKTLVMSGSVELKVKSISKCVEQYVNDNAKLKIEEVKSTSNDDESYAAGKANEQPESVTSMVHRGETCAADQTNKKPDVITSRSSQIDESCAADQTNKKPDVITSISSQIDESCAADQTDKKPDVITSISRQIDESCVADQTDKKPDVITSISTQIDESCAADQTGKKPDVISSMSNHEESCEKESEVDLQKNESGEWYSDLGQNKRVTFRSWKGNDLVDIREYYLNKKSGRMAPGKKGISLKLDEYVILRELVISDLLDKE